MVSRSTGVLSWLDPLNLGNPSFTHYVLQTSTDGQSWSTPIQRSLENKSVSIDGLVSDKDYWFRIRGENVGTVGQDTTYMNLNWARIKVRTPAAVVSDSPTSLVVSNVTSNGYKLAWSAPNYNGGSAITDFKVELSSDGGNTWRSAKQAASTSLSLNVSGAAPGTNYLVRVAAVNAVGLSEYLVGSLTTLAIAPSAPRSVTSSKLAATSLSLSWLVPASNGGSAITDYKVEVSSNGGLLWSTIEDGVANNLSVDVSNLLKNKIYKFRVSAINSVGFGFVSDVYEVRTLATVPSAPSALAVTDLQSNSVTLGWSAPADFGGVSLTDYVVETSRDGISWTVVPHAASVARSLKINGLAPGMAYQTRVSAVSSVGQSEFLTGSFSTLLVAPTVARSLSSSAVTATSLTLSWLLPSSNGGAAITDYKVEVSSNCSTYKVINRPISVNLGFNVTGLKPGTKYCFRVSAGNSIGYSAHTPALEVSTQGYPPAAPISLSVKAAKTSVTLGWKIAVVNGGSAVRNYIVEYSKNNGYTWLKVTKPVSTSRSLTIKGLRSKTTYLFRVTAVNDVGNSKHSKTLKVVTG
jgi:titin